MLVLFWQGLILWSKLKVVWSLTVQSSIQLIERVNRFVKILFAQFTFFFEFFDLCREVSPQLIGFFVVNCFIDFRRFDVGPICFFQLIFKFSKPPLIDSLFFLKTIDKIFVHFVLKNWMFGHFQSLSKWVYFFLKLKNLVFVSLNLDAVIRQLILEFYLLLLELVDDRIIVWADFIFLPVWVYQ